jgi:type IV pilus assembly protein PilX
MKYSYVKTSSMTSNFPLKLSIRNQRGVSLIIVLIFLLLAIISVLGAYRAGYLNERMVGNESDHSRTFAAAEAMIRDAEMDIRGRRPPYDVIQADGTIGFPCRPTTAGSETELTSAAGYENSCRIRNTAAPWFPQDNDEFDQVTDLVAGSTDRCLNGICMPLNTTDLATVETKLLNGLNANALGVPYGTYTRSGLTTAQLTSSQSNPILATSPASSIRAWYVVEAFRYGDPVSSGGHPSLALRPDPARKITYRITAVALGLKSGTRVVLKSTFVPFPANQSK